MLARNASGNYIVREFKLRLWKEMLLVMAWLVFQELLAQ